MGAQGAYVYGSGAGFCSGRSRCKAVDTHGRPGRRLQRLLAVALTEELRWRRRCASAAKAASISVTAQMARAGVGAKGEN
jgi:hypothetical protein